MASETIFCPACNNKLRVPDDLMGQEVQCPKCQRMFMAPPPPDAVLPAAVPARQVGGWDAEPQVPGPSRRKWPGIALMIVGTLHMLFQLYNLTVTLVDPGAVRRDYQESLKQMQAMFPMAKAQPQFDPVILTCIFAAIFFLLGLLQTVGGVCLLKGCYYALALVSAFLAVVSCCDPTCLAGLPIGIWALVVLFNSSVKAEFV